MLPWVARGTRTTAIAVTVDRAPSRGVPYSTAASMTPAEPGVVPAVRAEDGGARATDEPAATITRAAAAVVRLSLTCGASGVVALGWMGLSGELSAHSTAAPVG